MSRLSETRAPCHRRPAAARPRGSAGSASLALAAIVLAAAFAGCADTRMPPSGGVETPSATTAPGVDAESAAMAAKLEELGLTPARMDNGVLRIELPTNDSFASGSAELQAPTRRTLTPLLAEFRRPMARPWQLRVVGHSDDRGSERENDALSLLRAISVVHLFESAGIDAGRLQAVGMGERQPLATNAQRYGRELNRRVELFLFRAEPTATSATGAAPR